MVDFARRKRQPAALNCPNNTRTVGWEVISSVSTASIWKGIFLGWKIIGKKKHSCHSGTLVPVKWRLRPNPQGLLASEINGLLLTIWTYQSVNSCLYLKKLDSPLGQSLVAQIKVKRMGEKLGLVIYLVSGRQKPITRWWCTGSSWCAYIGSSLSNVNYVFDELTSGLHPHDAEKIRSALVGF